MKQTENMMVLKLQFKTSCQAFDQNNILDFDFGLK